MSSKLSLPVVIAIAGAAMAAGIATQRYLSAPAASTPTSAVRTLGAATQLTTPLALPAFALDGSDGPFTNAQLAGAWTVLFFGFTNCPDICPTTLATLATAAGAVRAEIPDLQVVFVSVDPARDGAEEADRYARFYDAGFVGITGSDTALQALTRPLGILYMSVPQGENAYTVDHSSSLLLIDPNGRLAAVFSAPHEAAAISADLLRITGASE